MIQIHDYGSYTLNCLTYRPLSCRFQNIQSALCRIFVEGGHAFYGYVTALYVDGLRLKPIPDSKKKQKFGHMPYSVYIFYHAICAVETFDV